MISAQSKHTSATIATVIRVVADDAPASDKKIGENKVVVLRSSLLYNRNYKNIDKYIPTVILPQNPYGCNNFLKVFSAFSQLFLQKPRKVQGNSRAQSVSVSILTATAEQSS